MKTRVLGITAVIGALALAGCAKHDAESLRVSFAQQVASIAAVRDFQRKGDDLTFSVPDAAGNEAKWRIHIDSMNLDHNDDKLKPYKGTIRSTWYMNGTAIEAATLDAHLPKGFKEQGVSRESSAVWEAQTRQWHW